MDPGLWPGSAKVPAYASVASFCSVWGGYGRSCGVWGLSKPRLDPSSAAHGDARGEPLATGPNRGECRGRSGPAFEPH